MCLSKCSEGREWDKSKEWVNEELRKEKKGEKEGKMYTLLTTIIIIIILKHSDSGGIHTYLKEKQNKTKQNWHLKQRKTIKKAKQSKSDERKRKEEKGLRGNERMHS